MFLFILGVLMGAGALLWFGPEKNKGPRHGEDLRHQHYRGQLKGGDKFVYCPVGNIVSWNAKDHDNKYCPYCRVYYEPI